MHTSSFKKSPPCLALCIDRTVIGTVTNVCVCVCVGSEVQHLLNRRFLDHFWKNMYPSTRRPAWSRSRASRPVSRPAPRRLDAPKRGARMLGAWCHEAQILEAPILGYWRLDYWRLAGYKACRPRLGGLALNGVIAGWLVLVLGCVLTRSTLREVGGYSMA